MHSKSMLLLTAFLQALTVRSEFTIQFGNEHGTYEFTKMPDNTDWDALEGASWFVRYATVVEAINMKFKAGEEVTLKFGFKGSEKVMKREQGAHTYIRNNAPGGTIDGIVEAEEELGLSSDFKNATNFVKPIHNSVVNGSSLVFIMKRQGETLYSIYNNGHVFDEEEALSIHTKLMAILGRLRDIKFVHGDINPETIVLVRRDDLKDPICLVDLGFAVYEGSDVGCVGSERYDNPAQVLANRRATYEDCVISGAYAVTLLFARYLPWFEIIEHAKERFRRNMTLMSKIEFNANPFGTYPPESIVHSAPKFVKAVKQTIQDAIANEPKKEEVSKFYADRKDWTETWKA